MTGKGLEAQRTSCKRAYRIRKGEEQPIQYHMTVKEALRAAGIPICDGVN
jgi:hypothetical protein